LVVGSRELLPCREARLGSVGLEILDRHVNRFPLGGVKSMCGEDFRTRGARPLL